MNVEFKALSVVLTSYRYFKEFRKPKQDTKIFLIETGSPNWIFFDNFKENCFDDRD